jgi:uncharacterized membrane protein HdeD (DUF308 family)
MEIAMPTNTPELRVSPELGRSWGWLTFLGVILIVGGILLLVAPVVGGLVVTTWIAAIFMVAGVFQIIHAFQARGWKSGLWQGLSGLIYLVGGFLAFFNPLAGAIALTIVLAVTFLVDGVVRIALAIGARPIDHWGWVLFGGIVSLLVGIYILFVGGSPAASLILLGVFAGVSFLFEGIAFLMLGLSARQHRGA